MFKKFVVTGVALASLAAASAAVADTKDKKIALSNNYAGNSWRQAMLKSWDKVTKQAVADGIVAAADPFTTAGTAGRPSRIRSPHGRRGPAGAVR